MDFSFILTTSNNDNPESLAKFLATIFSFKKKNFEIIVVDNYFYNDSVLKITNEYFNRFPKQMQLITSYRSLDVANSRNLAIVAARGTYIAFLNPSETINKTFFTDIEAILAEHKTIDCFEYRTQYHWEAKINFETEVRIPEKQIYNLKEEKNKKIFALVSPILSTKLFKKTVITDHNLTFRKPLQFDSFFLYAFLANCENFYPINNVAITCDGNIFTNDNSFELLNQWIHILNYYNNLRLKKTLNKELEYAHIRYALYNLMQIIALSDNAHLIQKVYDHVKEYIAHRYKNFATNPYLNEARSNNDEFPDIAKNFSKYFKKYFYDNNIKDDSRYWE